MPRRLSRRARTIAPRLAAQTSAPRRRTAVNTAIFSAATGLSRIAGLVREVVAASFFGTTGAASAFTLAFQIPNLVRALVADAALSSAFVPVFSELLEHKRRKEAYQLASALAGLLLVALGGISLLFILLAPHIVPIFTGSDFSPELDQLCIGLSQVLFPIVVLLGLNGLAVGILNAHDHFTIPAIAPLVWNVVIILGMVGLAPLFKGENRIYAYAIGVVGGTIVQLAMMIPALRNIGFPVAKISLPRRGDPRVRRVLTLMLPVSVGLGLINIDLLLNTTIGSLISVQAPRAIDAAFRIYMLPQGMFSVAVATVLFPQLSRLAARGDRAGLIATTGVGARQIALTLIPSAAAIAVLVTPMVRLVYQRGEFDAHSTQQTAEALLVFSFSLPFSGWNLLLTRTFFSLQRPWLPTALAGLSLVVNTIISLALYKPLGIAGPVLGTVVSNVLLTWMESVYLRRELGGLEIAETARACFGMVVGAGMLAEVAYAVHWFFTHFLGTDLIAEVIAVGGGLTAGGYVYLRWVLFLGIPEAHQVVQLFARRVARAKR
jgi:putative peptidoglycan lipid II flippase